MGRIAVYKTKPTATKSGVSNIAHLSGKKGIYHIYENSTRVYVGSSTSDLYKTILRHFQQWEDSNQEKRISYKDRLGKFSYTVQIEEMDGKTQKEIENREYQLIAKYQPRDNKLRKYCNVITGECKSKVEKAKEAIKKNKKNAAIQKAQPKRAAAKKVAKKAVSKKRAPKNKIDASDIPF